MGNKGKINENEAKKKASFWKYGGIIGTFMVLGTLVIQFLNQSETEELSVDNNHKQTVLKEELKQEEPPVFENKEMFVSSPSNKKKTVKLKKKNSHKDLLLKETIVVEDTIVNSDAKVVSEPYRYSHYNRGYTGQIPGLKISTGTGNHLEKNRHPETILKDVENLTRNGNYTYIVDGVRVSEETFRSLNQNDVESVDIYKHTDVYNARFGNKENQSRITLEAR